MGKFVQHLILTESTRGKAAWEKYFSGREVPSTIKTDVKPWLPDGGTSGDTLPAETAVVVVSTEEYNPRTLVRVAETGKFYRVPIDSLAKPFAAAKVFDGYLKPDLIGISGEFDSSSYPSVVKQKIAQIPKLPQAYRVYLSALVDLARNIDDAELKETVTRLFMAAKANTDIDFVKTVNNDFMEVLGPLLYGVESGQTISFPSAGNHPLYDFTIDEVQFSSKKYSGNVNTIKVKDVIEHLNQDPSIINTHKDEMTVLMMINNTATKDTPEQLNKWLTNRFEDYVAQPEIDTTQSPQEIKSARLKMETAVINWINRSGRFDFVPLVQYALSHVLYLKSGIRPRDGTIVVAPITSGGELTSAKLRSKGRLDEKIGFAV